MIGQPPTLRAVVGICSDDLVQLERALAGMDYPADKWQLIAQAQQKTGRGADMRTIGMLWALPAGRYRDLAQVLTGVARTARGHPRRAGLTRSAAATDR